MVLLGNMEGKPDFYVSLPGSKDCLILTGKDDGEAPKSHKPAGELRTSRCNEELQVEAADPSAGGTSSLEFKTFPLFKLGFFQSI